ncbi:MAG: beta-ketoacyl-ACP synthase III [Desulfovibrionaceae bacterium]
MSTHAIIRGLGFYVPPKVLTNADLETFVETSDEWITTRTGIKQRHVVEPGVPVSSLAVEAAKNALADAGMEAEELTHIFMATLTPDTYCPSAACYLEEKLGIRGRMAVDCNAACSGFLYTTHLARAMTLLEPGAKVLVCSGEVLTSRINWNDRATCVLFGDGCGAVVITAPDTPAGANKTVATIVDTKLSSDGSLADLLTVKGGGSSRPLAYGEATGDEFYIQMMGREVYKHAVRSMEAVSTEMLERNGLTTDDVDLFVPHQANLRIIEAVGKKLGFAEGKVFVNVDRYGNTSAASVPIALAEARATGAIKPGYKVLVTTFGGGFTWGSTLLQF